ncbi:MAG: N-acetylglucosamine kinase, partial [Bacteroidia bacterium]
LGRELLRKYLYQAWSPEIQQRITNRFELSRNEILDRIYKQAMPNRFLASFSKFIFQNIEQPEMSELVIQNFRNFFQQHITSYSRAQEVPLHITGSVGFYYSNILRRVASEFKVNIGQVTETPIAGLCLYHHPEND